MNTKTLIALSAVAIAATSFTPAFARQGADDPVGHVRREDRQADRSTEVRSSSVDRTSAAREVNDVRREDRQADRREDRRADRAPQ